MSFCVCQHYPLLYAKNAILREKFLDLDAVLIEGIIHTEGQCPSVNPVRKSEYIEDTVEPMTLLKRKALYNHIVRLNPRFSDMFSSSASGASIIIQLFSEPCSLLSMNFAEKKRDR